MPQMHISAYSLAETFDIGRDTGTQVSKMYEDPFPFSGRLDRVIFTVSDENAVPPRKLPAVYHQRTSDREFDLPEKGCARRSALASRFVTQRLS